MLALKCITTGEKYARNNRSNPFGTLASWSCDRVHDGGTYSWTSGYRDRGNLDSCYSGTTRLSKLMGCLAVHYASRLLEDTIHIDFINIVAGVSNDEKNYLVGSRNHRNASRQSHRRC